MSAPTPFSPAKTGVRVAVRLSPKASRDHIAGLRALADGGVALKVAVTAAPEHGRANAALIKLLAKSWHMAKSRITVVSGATDRRKTLLVAGDPESLLPQLQDWMKVHHG